MAIVHRANRHQGGAMIPRRIPDVVDTGWLIERLGAPELRVIDATWSMAAAPSSRREAYEQAHIPGALFLDLDTAADPAGGLPHTLAPASHFGAVVGALGIARDDVVVVYDRAGMQTSPRAWWLFKAYGHGRVAVLDGGLPKWIMDNGPVDDGRVALPARRYRADEPWAMPARRRRSWRLCGPASRSSTPAALGVTEAKNPSPDRVYAAAISRAAAIFPIPNCWTPPTAPCWTSRA